MLAGRSLGSQVGMPVGQMIHQGPGLMASIGQVPRVDNAGPDPGGLGLRAAEHLLGGALVGAPLPHPPLAIGVGEPVIPAVAALSQLLGHVTPPSSYCAGAGSRPPTRGPPGLCPPSRTTGSTVPSRTCTTNLGRCRSSWRWRNGSSPRTGSPLEFAR